jgi:hypothetical protein
LLATKSVKFPVLHKPGKPTLSGRLADQFQGKPGLAAPGSPGQHTDRQVSVARDPVLQVFDGAVAPQQRHDVGPVRAQQCCIRSIATGALRPRLEVGQAKMRNAGVDRNRNAVPAADGLDNDVVATLNASDGGRRGHVSLLSTA